MAVGAVPHAVYLNMFAGQSAWRIAFCSKSQQFEKLKFTGIGEKTGHGG